MPVVRFNQYNKAENKLVPYSFAVKPVFVADTFYEKDDMVFHNGRWWQAKADFTTTEGFDPANWNDCSGFPLDGGSSGGGGFPSEGRGIRYSLEEQKTGDYWIDGKPIYQRSWQGITSSGQTDWNIVAHVPEIEQIVDFKVLMPNTQGAWWLRNFNTWGMAAGFAETKRLQFCWYGSNNVMNKPYTATAWYTKTTDAPDQG